MRKAALLAAVVLAAAFTTTTTNAASKKEADPNANAAKLMQAAFNPYDATATPAKPAGKKVAMKHKKKAKKKA
jgi:outer membrane PBP1 activator LpoA protein